MADNLDDGEFWLPPQFLDEVDDDDDDKAASFASNDDPLTLNNADDASFQGFVFGSFVGVPTSNLSSPVGGSSEAESDEDDHLLRRGVAELTRRVARTTVDSDSKIPEKKSTGGSPQSTLCPDGSKCGCRNGSSEGSPNGASNHCAEKATWDLLHAAAGEVERMQRLNQQDGCGFNNGVSVPQGNPPPTLHNNNNSSSNINNATNPDVGLCTQPSLSYQQLRIAQIQMLKGSVWCGTQKKQSGGGGGAYQPPWQRNPQMAPNRGKNNNTIRPLGLSASAWPSLQHATRKNHHQHKNMNQPPPQPQPKPQPQPQPQPQAQYQAPQQQYGPGWRPVYIPAGPGSGGTGVFLPRPTDSPLPPRKKKPDQHCVLSGSTVSVLVPARVAQALNLKVVDDMVEGQPQQQHLNRFNARSNMEENVAAAVPRVKSNYVNYQEKSDIMPQREEVNNEISLPQEWTY